MITTTIRVKKLNKELERLSKLGIIELDPPESRGTITQITNYPRKKNRIQGTSKQRIT